MQLAAADDPADFFRRNPEFLGKLQQRAKDLGIWMMEVPEEFGEHRTIHTLVALIDQRRAALRTQARSLGTRIYAEEPDAYVARLSKYWDAWSIEVENSATFTDSGVSPLN